MTVKQVFDALADGFEVLTALNLGNGSTYVPVDKTALERILSRLEPKTELQASVNVSELAIILENW